MATYTIFGDQTDTINFAPATVVEEVLQNVRIILTTIKYSVPLDRQFGIDGHIVDLPIHQAQAVFSAEIFNAIKRYEPRTEIQSISFAGDQNGRLRPRLEVSVNES